MMNEPITIELLFAEGCASGQQTLDLVEKSLAAQGIDVEIKKTIVHSEDQVRRLNFLGSPTIRINGVDIEPETANRSDYSLG